MKRKTIDIITLGCSKNLVDSEHLMRQLEEAGFCVTHDAERPKGQIARLLSQQEFLLIQFLIKVSTM